MPSRSDAGTKTPRPVESMADGVLAPLAGGALRALDIDGTHAAGFFVLQGVVTPDAARTARNRSCSRTEDDR